MFKESRSRWLAGFAAVATLTFVGGSAAAVTPDEPDNIAPDSVGYSDIRAGAIGQKQIIPNVVGYNQMGPASVWQKQLAPNVVDESRLTPALRAKVNSAVQPVSVTAVTTLINRPDSGHYGTWADDNLTRTVSITRQAAVEASHCGGGATTCWFYTGSLSDIGSFTTREGEKSPNADVVINGQVSGSTAGGSKLQFYSSSGTPQPSLVPSVVTGFAPANATSVWGSLFFPDGTVVTSTELLGWAWTYNAPGTCETWVNAASGDTGNIAGVNAC